jgi:hypothetical protein
MAKIELKGFIESIGVEAKLGDNQTRVQRVIFRVPAYTDQFGDKKGQDEYWDLGVMGSKIDELNLANKILPSKKAVATVYVNSKFWYKKEDTAKQDAQYSIYAILYDVTHVA